MPTYPQENYAGIIKAINDVRTDNAELPKFYSSNFAGIIEALKDLGQIGEAGSNSYPPNWIPEYDENGNIIGGGYDQIPANGKLWFDVRQGRLMVFEDGDWYQANGADGLTAVGESIPEREVLGAFWYNTNNNSLYIFNGETWSLVGGASTQDTSALALSNPTTGRYTDDANYLPSPGILLSQEHANIYYYDCLRALDTQLLAATNSIPELPNVTQVDAAPPASPEMGDFWYDTSTPASLKVWDGVNWLYTDTQVKEDIAATNSEISAYKASNDSRVGTIENDIDTLQNVTDPTYALGTSTTVNGNNRDPGIYLNSSDGLVSSVVRITGGGNIGITDLDGILVIDDQTTTTALQTIQDDYLVKADKDSLQAAIDNLSNTLSSRPEFPVEIFNELKTKVATLPTFENLSTALPLQGGRLSGDLDLGGYQVKNIAEPLSPNDTARKQEVDDLERFVESNFFRKNGGVLQTVQLKNNQSSTPTFDFSGTVAYGKKALKFKSNGPGSTATFGTNSNLFEYAWDFTDNEDFCWTHSIAGKACSINRDGIAAKQVLIGNFATNDVNGRVMSNPIDVGAKLASHDTSIHSLLTSSVATGANVNTLVGTTSAQTVPVDVNGDDNYLFLVVNKANGAIAAVDKTFLEAEG